MVIQEIQQALRVLERIETGSAGTKTVARIRLAGKLKCSLGTLENIIYGRVKTVTVAMHRKINDLLIKEIGAEIERLNHELELYRKIGARLDTATIRQIESSLSTARTLLYGEQPKPAKRKRGRPPKQFNGSAHLEAAR